MSKFPETLKNLRHSRQLTQPDLADILGTSRSAVSMYETGKREPDFETMEALADYFNVDMNYLYTGTHAAENYGADETPPSLPSLLPPDLTSEELDLMSAYRHASEADRQAITLILSKYT